MARKKKDEKVELIKTEEPILDVEEEKIETIVQPQVKSEFSVKVTENKKSFDNFLKIESKKCGLKNVSTITFATNRYVYINHENFVRISFKDDKNKVEAFVSTDEKCREAIKSFIKQSIPELNI
jgi:hypothetical protein